MRGTVTRSEMTVIRRPDGTMDLFVRGTDGVPYREQVASDSSVLQSWVAIGRAGQVLGAPVGTWNTAGSQLDIYAVGTNHTVYHIAQTPAGWGDWTPMNDNGTAG